MVEQKRIAAKKKASAKKRVTKKRATKKRATKKQAAKKQTAKKQTAKKQTAKKTPAKKQTAKKTPARKQRAKKKAKSKAQASNRAEAARVPISPRTSRSIQSYIKGLAPLIGASMECPAWPPDLFAIVASLLSETGGHLRVLALEEKKRDNERKRRKEDADAARRDHYRSWAAEVQSYGEEWQRDLIPIISGMLPDADERDCPPAQPPELRRAVPDTVKKDWNIVQEYCDQPLGKLYDHEDLCGALLRLLSVSDTACKYFGLGGARGREDRPRLDLDVVDKDMERALIGVSYLITLARFNPRESKSQSSKRSEEQTAHSLTWLVPRDRIQVLPKIHTPQRGLTIRSLSHNLGLCQPRDVHVGWRSWIAAPRLKTRGNLNLLVLPWPRKIEPSSFSASPNRDLPDRFGYFDFTRKSDPDDFSKELKGAIRGAEKFCAKIDGIIFPELGLTVEEHEIAKRIASNKGAFLIGGVGKHEGLKEPTNTSSLHLEGYLIDSQGHQGVDDDDDGKGSPRPHLVFSQGKHHRWCLDRDQILQYGLGGRLSAVGNWWERIQMGPRTLNFVNLNSELTFCVLICEDLARQDPVAEIIRTIGPNLVIALLMDGPQIRGRWSSRYASVLTEDPGSSVLCVTSLGMSKLTSKNIKEEKSYKDKSDVIALWRDVFGGERELSVGDTELGGVLSLAFKSGVEYTADGRKDMERVVFPTFGGFHRIQKEEK